MGSMNAAAELENPHEFPDVLWELWSWFRALQAARASDMGSPEPMSFSEIKDFCQLMRLKPSPWEVAALCQLDRLALGATAEKPKDEE